MGEGLGLVMVWVGTGLTFKFAVLPWYQDKVGPTLHECVYTCLESMYFYQCMLVLWTHVSECHEILKAMSTVRILCPLQFHLLCY